MENNDNIIPPENNNTSQDNNTNNEDNTSQSVNVVQPVINEDNPVVDPIEDKRDFADKAIDKVESFMDTKDHSSNYTQDDVNKNRNNALLCYIPFVSLYFILKGDVKNSEFLKFHANEGLDITILLVIVYFITNILSSIFKESGLILNSIPGWLEVLISIMYFICILYMLFGVIYTVNGSSKELPIIGKIRLIK